jgi:mutator protein MutT
MRRITVAIGVVQREGKILICQRHKDNTLGGFWEFPGGKREDDESIQECLHRELLEEVGIKIAVIRELTAIAHDYSHGQVALHPFLCKHVDGEASPLQCQQIKWVKPQELFNFRFPPANDSLLAEIVEIIGSDAKLP